MSVMLESGSTAARIFTEAARGSLSSSKKKMLSQRRAITSAKVEESNSLGRRHYEH